MGKEILDIHCPQCGAPANFDIIHQVYGCGYCGGTMKVEAALEEKKDYRDAQQKKMKKSAEAFALESASCSGCGATIVFGENEALSKCAFCGRSLVRKEYLYDAGLPESVIPFGITKAEAQQRLEEWCDRNRRKKEAKRLRSMIPELKGFYLPYETVRGPVRCRVSCKRTAKVYGFDGFVNDEFVNGSKQLDNLLLNAMEPFDLDGLEAFDFAYLAGQRVKITDISSAEAERRMIEEISENYRPQLEKMWGTKAIEVGAEAKSAVRLPVLLPVYYISSGDICAAVNGQTGKVSVRADGCPRLPIERKLQRSVFRHESRLLFDRSLISREQFHEICLLKEETKVAKFVMKSVASGLKFDLKAGNGEVIATSEVYTTEAACRNGVASVVKNAAEAVLEDQTEKDCAVRKNPKFELYADRAGEFRFRLKARNGQVIAVSEGYKAKAGCLNGIESVRKNAPNASVEKA